ncbi:4-phosphopantoate--beta-alanine ligase [Methanogenium organophilum]|uniref:4-phosphopantoate--beta-alanine ligase n=1 Tax=Methanogenium organophilum TaxID=2199 RepID=A0A9X9S456_METOG|nr:4-phosphopantoate--beta-alanine ligase [Methanogenium organophilum]WAI01153.1 4-phosphopantoate--beta-alanine ligase [Methanogenium organophilum]
MIPDNHPRYRSLVARERIADAVRSGIVVVEGASAHGRGEAFDYLLCEKTSESALLAEKTAAAYLMAADRAIISVNGNTAALAADEIRELAEASGAAVEVNLFHRTDERMAAITAHLKAAGVTVLEGTPERLLPLSHDRALCLRDGIGTADVVLVPLEDGDRCEALVAMGKTVITIDLNPLSRTAQTATVTIVDELTRALPNITRACRDMTPETGNQLVAAHDNTALLRAALRQIQETLADALD